MPSQYEMIKSALKYRQTGIFVIISTDNVDTYVYYLLMETIYLKQNEYVTMLYLFFNG